MGVRTDRGQRLPREGSRYNAAEAAVVPAGLVIGAGVERVDLGPDASVEDADLLIAGAKGTGGVTRFLLGSTARRVAHYAGYPVLVVGSRGRSAISRPLRGSVVLSVLKAAPCPVLVGRRVAGGGAR